MKYRILAIALALILVGCGSNPQPVRSGSTEEIITKKPIYSTTGLPEWFLNPPQAEDVYYGVGTAKKQNPSLAKKTATARARDEIAQAVQVEVNTMLKDFMQESGVGNNAQALEFTESVSKQVASVSLSGSIIEKTDIGRDGTIYVLVKYSVDGARQAALAEVKKQEALYNEFKAEQSFDELEEAIRNMK